MITCEHELADRLEKLRRDTLSTIWRQPSLSTLNATDSGRDLVEDLILVLTAIKNTKDYAVQRREANALKDTVNIEIDCDPCVDINF